MVQEVLKVQYPELAEEAVLIMKKCDRLPLAICVIGGFLADQPKTLLAWRSLNRHIRDELDINPELEMIKNVLSKSFDGLSHHLKCCFLYISIFPEDHHISRRRLVRRWIAEGYSSEGHSESQEEIADRYFTQLISRSMLQPSKQKSIRSRKVIDSCQVHDMMREISILRSTEENLVLRLEKGCSSSMQGKPRHLVVSNWNGGQSQFERVVDPSGIRSLTVFGKWRAFILSHKMRFLRVLDLEDTSELVQHHLEHIGEFLHMKYLSLRGCRGIYYLPDSIGNLKQLQTLDITGTSIIMLPKTVIKLRKLQYLRAWAKYQQESYDLSESCAACCAPEIMGDVLQSSGNYFRSDVCTFCCCLMFPTYAQKLTAPGVAVPRGVRRLKALHTLGAVNIAVDKAILQDIGRLTRLRKLAVTNVDKKNCQDLGSALDRLINLESLFVRSSEDQELNLVKPCLYEPPASLQSLKLVGANLFSLVSWKAKVMNLVKLKLKFTNISDATATMKHLGELPKLSILRLLRGSFRWAADLKLEFPAEASAFPSLRVLEVDRIEDLKLVKFGKGSAPKLELLQYRGLTCSKDNANSQLFSGINLLPSLKEFLLHRNHDYHDNFIEKLEQQLQASINKPVLKRY